MHHHTRRITAALAAASLTLTPLTLTGCEDLPGSPKTQGAVGGGAAGAAAGALIGGEDNRLVGALLGGVLGAGGGYLLGANKDKLWGDGEESSAEAQQAIQDAQTDPATASMVADASTADLDDDGFVTLDEVVAMENAGLSDAQMVDRLEATDQVFDVSESQANRLRAAGVSPYVIQRMASINSAERDRYLEQQDNVLTDTST